MVYLIVVVLGIALVVYLRMNNRYTVKAPWQHFFDGADFAASEFYQQVEAEIRAFKVPDVSYGRESFFQTHIASSRQEYLKIKRGEYVIYICAAAFGRGTFISQWSCLKVQKQRNNIPVISKLLGMDRNDKSFYQADTEGMFQSAVHTALMNVVDGLTTAKGIRGLTEMERHIQLGK
ncbi:hypothetical protein [Flavipsychrobacter stenotrophus]|nr:hypothetical protein [Flavipsychrobacter stenotrophus]